MNAYRLLVTRK